MKTFVKKVVPDKHWDNFRNVSNYIIVNLQGFSSIFHNRTRIYFCPVCKTHSLKFKDYGSNPRKNVLCPMCRSLERDRFAWLFLTQKIKILQTIPLKMLHFAPEPCLEKKLRKALGNRYITADLYDPAADLKVDITNIHLPDERFDIVYCSHVLEHISDDIKAMQEMQRVLKTNGCAIIAVPIKGAKTIEDKLVTDPKQREILYGQENHVRYYGMDIVNKLKESGFHVDVIYPNSFLKNDEIEKYSILNDEILFYCTPS